MWYRFLEFGVALILEIYLSAVESRLFSSYTYFNPEYIGLCWRIYVQDGCHSSDVRTLRSYHARATETKRVALYSIERNYSYRRIFLTRELSTPRAGRANKTRSHSQCAHTGAKSSIQWAGRDREENWDNERRKTWREKHTQASSTLWKSDNLERIEAKTRPSLSLLEKLVSVSPARAEGWLFLFSSLCARAKFRGSIEVSARRATRKFPYPLYTRWGLKFTAEERRKTFMPGIKCVCAQRQLTEIH